LTATQKKRGLLLAAHGERDTAAQNAGVVKLAAVLQAQNVATHVAYGFIRGQPTIGEAMRTFGARKVVVYPLFMSDGYFTRVKLAQLLDEVRQCGSRQPVRTLAPLGVDPRLADVVIDVAERAAVGRGLRSSDVTLLLVAHGSTKDTASRSATLRLAETIDGTGRFAEVRYAFLEEAPSIATAVGDAWCPMIALGLFAGEGLHGGHDVPHLIAATGRTDIEFLGNVGSLPQISGLIAAAVAPLR
jgi:sirohydrochlorin ferrochelatase